MQQHLMQMQPMMGGYASPNPVTTELIQQYLDENKQLILAILDSQSAGKAEECAENQAKLQRNLMYLAAIADSQPQLPTIAQFPPNAVIQPGTRYMQHQQAQPLTPQSLIAARSSMLYAQSPMSALQQQQQAALHSQLGMSSGASSGGFNVLRGETSVGGNGALNAGVFPDFGHNAGAGKQDMGNAVSTDSRGGNSTGQNGDGTEPLYLKSSEEEGN
ncbi:GRF-interacting factor 1 isoform X1 [Dioscorea cayenensis subsp. rotundata]|uniref:GRF-interacting factor 1 isoform X1 n=2 Tax=Dioscorea cayennensis subsp. rotundata TaxID=55577 RepID=A0AB40CKZ7_DIOCR|nr:GRF-interacting factor 1 isoform X1 [Dioscorea cayenensis subsp. rotundata]